jgi:two-component system, LytTR family, sensor kinase
MSRFWAFQLAGWATYAVAMALSRVGRFPLEYMVVSKFVLAAAGLLCSLALRRVYRMVLRRESRVVALVAVAVAASYLGSLVWTAADNLADQPIAAALLDRPVRIRDLAQLFNGSVYNAFTLLSWSVLYFAVRHHQTWLAARERALRAESLASRARLEALRWQLQPHLLFNTLNGISTLVAERRNAEASKMLSRLSDFLRMLLAAPHDELVALPAEIDLIERYLELEQVRFGPRLRSSIEVAPDAWPALLPPLLLQPVVENAIRHGIAPREEGGAIRLQVERADDRLRIMVIDGGGGAFVEGEVPGARIGLANVRERLERLYPGDHVLSIEPADRGSRVLIEMPFETGATRS